jgi:hypothetical protein
MKKLMIYLFIVIMALPVFGAIDPSIDSKKTWKNSYRWTGRPKDKLLDWAVAMEDAIDGTGGFTFLYLIPGDGPAVAKKGDVRFTVGNNLQYYTSSWQTVAASTSSTLDEAYSAGQAITVDAGVMSLTATDAASNVVFAIDQLDTGALNAFTITGDATKALIDFDQNGTGGDIDGSDDSWSISKTGAFVIKGSMTYDTADVLFDATDTGKDVEWDESQEVMHFLDNAILGIGGATTAAPDFAIRHDATDVDVIPAITTAVWKWGDGTNDIDMWWYGSAAGDYFWWDESGSELLFVDAHGTVTFGTDDDFVISSAADGVLTIEPDAQGNSISFGSADTKSMTLIWYTDVSGDTITFDEENVLLDIVDVDVRFDDDALLLFGDSDDVEVQYDGTKNQLEIREPTAGGPAIVQIVGGEGQEGRLIIAADNDDDSTDQWQLDVDTSGTLSFGNDASADSFTDYLTIAAGTGLMTLKEGESISNNTDDSIILTSNDEHMTLLILGHSNAKSAILDLTADAGNDNDDTWTHTVADGGAYTVACEGTATMTLSEALTVTGVITMAEGEVISNAVDDTISLTSNDNHMTLLILGEAGAKSAILDLSADAAADNADTWTHTVADGGAYTIANEGTATMTISEAVTISGQTTVGSFVLISQIVTDAAAYQVTAANSGKIHTIQNLTQPTTIKLPPEAAGLNYEFWYVGTAAEADDHIITTEDNGKAFIGGVVFHDTSDGSVESVIADQANNSEINLNNLNVGSVITFTCDGTDWYMTGRIVSDTVPVIADQ